MQLKWFNLNTRTNCWARDVKQLLEELGFGYAWYNKGVGNKYFFLTILKQRLFDIDTQVWRIDIHDMSKLRTYNERRFSL